MEADIKPKERQSHVGRNLSYFYNQGKNPFHPKNILNHEISPFFERDENHDDGFKAWC